MFIRPSICLSISLCLCLLISLSPCLLFYLEIYVVCVCACVFLLLIRLFLCIVSFFLGWSVHKLDFNSFVFAFPLMWFVHYVCRCVVALFPYSASVFVCLFSYFLLPLFSFLLSCVCFFRSVFVLRARLLIVLLLLLLFLFLCEVLCHFPVTPVSLALRDAGDTLFLNAF